MKTVRIMLSLLRSAIKHDGERRRERVERRPIVEPMEPRALLSALEPAGAKIAPPHHPGSEPVILLHQPPAFHVMYQASHEGASSVSAQPPLAEPACAAEHGTAQTMAMTAADDTGGDPTDDTDDDSTDDDSADDTDDDNDGDDGDGDNGDEIDDENDP